MKTYVTGPSSATTAILYIYDIFGFFPQTLQGADILAHADKEHQYQVFMPDFFHGKPADISWFPPDTDEKGKKLGDFFAGIGAPPKAVEKVPAILKEAEGQNANIKNWGAVGMCWGGKVVSFTSGSDTKFSAAAEVHPAMVDPNDAKNISIPLAMLASKDEDAKAVEAFAAELKGKKLVKTYGDQIHGWMAARSNLDDANVAKQYEDGYKTLLDFFHEHL